MDLLRRKTSLSDADLGARQYTYDAAGNLVTQTDARGVTLWFGYDNLNRLTAKRQTDATGPLLAQYWYDEAQAGYANVGRRTRAAAYEYRDGWGSSTTLTNTLAQNYDARGRVKAATRTADGASYTTQYAYDPADRVTGITYPDNEQVTTAYGSQGRPSSLTSTLGVTLTDSASYDAANRLTSMRYPAGGNLVRRQVYYPWTTQRSRLQNLLVGTSATVADRLNLTYAYDAVGNVQSINDNGVLSSFGYDGLYQLTSAYGQSFSYDTAGRITNFNGLIYTPDAQHPHAVNLVNGADRYDYDLNGNLVVRNKGVINQEQYLAWDYDNRLAAVTYTNLALAGGGGGTPSALPRRVFLPLVVKQEPAERYSYDADGARVRKESKTEITRVIGPHYEVVIAVASGQVLTTTKYYDFGGQRIAVRQNGTLSYLHGDHLGSTSVTTNNSGAATNNVRYFAYGGQRGTGSIFGLPTDHTFTGQKLDRGTGLMYYGARYYDSGLGTFVSPDPIIPNPGNPQDLNRYSYVTNNPLRYTDPTGHAWREDDSGGAWYPPTNCASILCLPTPTAQPTWTPFLQPYATPAPPILRAAPAMPYTSPSLGPGSPRMPDPTPAPILQELMAEPGQINWADLYHTIVLQGLLTEFPQVTGQKTAIHAAGRSGQLLVGPLVAYAASVGPGLYENASQHAPLRVTLTDMVVDTGGYVFSIGTGVVGAVGVGVGGAMANVAVSPLAVAVGNIGGAAVGSVAWDLGIAPRIRDDVYRVWGVAFR